MINDSAIMAWKFPVMNGIICDGDTVIHWGISTHPTIPTSVEIAQWRLEYDAWALTNLVQKHHEHPPKTL